MLTERLDFGPIGSATWRHFPEVRSSIRELVCDELDSAIEEDRFPEAIEHFKYVLNAVSPLLFDRLGVVDLDPDLVRRFCLFCREVLDYSGPDSYDVSYTFQMYVLESLDGPSVVRLIKHIDPGLVDLVRTRYPGSWADE
ncbi:hypothetical protein ACIBTV_20070 [Micromonospora sp. NPDC049366]|uniref:hypothetical protein n=1 Tax=Micromonospora sp. NPDC049366 TaxID=3364271 RepID=UPI0037BC78DA